MTEDGRPPDVTDPGPGPPPSSSSPGQALEELTPLERAFGGDSARPSPAPSRPGPDPVLPVGDAFMRGVGKLAWFFAIMFGLAALPLLPAGAVGLVLLLAVGPYIVLLATPGAIAAYVVARRSFLVLGFAAGYACLGLAFLVVDQLAGLGGDGADWTTPKEAASVVVHAPWLLFRLGPLATVFYLLAPAFAGFAARMEARRVPGPRRVVDHGL